MSRKTHNVGIQKLIKLVETKPALWDKAHSGYKDKTEIRNSWEEICGQLFPDYESLGEWKKEEFMRYVVKKWRNVRDAFMKSLKKEKEAIEAGVPYKKYIYKKQLQFYVKMLGSQISDSTSDEEDIPINEKKQQCRMDIFEQLHQASKEPKEVSVKEEFLDVGSLADEDSVSEYQVVEEPPKIESTPPKKKRKVNTPELDVSDGSGDPNYDRHIYFFKSIVPSLCGFTEDQVLQFQIGVLQLASQIRKENIVDKQSKLVQQKKQTREALKTGTSGQIHEQPTQSSCNPLEVSRSPETVSSDDVDDPEFNPQLLQMISSK